MDILEPKTKSATKVVSIRLPLSVSQDLDHVRKLADDAGFVFALNRVIGDSIAKAIKQARAELNSKSSKAQNA